ncbi:MAG: bestrophin family ion channel [Mycobacterium sp.]
MKSGPFKSLRIVALVSWQLRYDLLAVVAVALVMMRMAGSPVFKSVEPVVPLLGVVVSIFIGFRNSSAYNRWWEARTLWGAVIGNSRSVSNALIAVDDRTPEMAVISDRMRRRQVRHAWRLAAELRGVPVSADVSALTPEDPADATAGDLLALQARDTRDLRLGGMIDPQGRVILTNLNTAQAAAAGGLERIRHQPIPPYYAIFVRSLAWLFAILVCTRLDVGGHAGATGMVASIVVMAVFIVAERLGHFIEEPMDNTVFDLPMDRFCARITADLLGSEHPLTQFREGSASRVLEKSA